MNNKDKNDIISNFALPATKIGENMKIIISPAKKMKVNELVSYESKPLFPEKTKYLVEMFKKFSVNDFKKVFNVNEKIAVDTYNYYQSFSYDGISTAILSYDGIQYQYMNPSILESSELEYLNDNMFIISGLYGVVRPFDLISLYRLEMGLKYSFDGYENLYQYWEKEVSEAIFASDEIILDLASKEYSKILYDNKNKGKIISVLFYEKVNNKLIEKGVYVKMARGAMVKYLAKRKIKTIDEVKMFNDLGYKYDENSPKDKLIFIREESK